MITTQLLAIARGWVWEGNVSPSARSAEALSVFILEMQHCTIVCNIGLYKHAHMRRSIDDLYQQIYQIVVRPWPGQPDRLLRPCFSTDNCRHLTEVRIYIDDDMLIVKEV